MPKAKKRVVKQKTNSKEKEKKVLNFFFLGIIIVVVIQVIFMFVGMVIENNMGMPITGLPSSIGLTLVLIIGLMLNKKSEFILLGSFTLAFLSPVILLLIITFKALTYSAPQIYYSITYMAIMILCVWVYFVNKILKGKL